MNIAVGSDHAGFLHKNALAEMLRETGHTVLDMGTHSLERADYPDFAVAVGRSVASGEARFGLLICGSGIGVAITANKVSGVRAATCMTQEMASLARAHNDANVLCLGQRLTSLFEARYIVRAFLAGSFEGGRHAARVEKIHDLTGR